MKLALFYLGTKGVCDEAYEMARELSSKCEILCVISRKVENYHLWVQESGLNENFSLLHISVGNTVLSGVLGLFNLPLFIRIINLINQFSPDAVYSYMSHPWERMIIPFLHCKATLRSIHDSEPHLGDKSLKRYLMDSFNYKSRWYVTYSTDTKEKLVNKGFNEKDILVVPLACTSIYSNESSVIDNSKKNKFLFWGRIEEYKGLDILLKAVVDVFSSHTNSMLIIAGQGDINQYSSLIEMSKANIQLDNRWIANDEIPSFFLSVDFVVLPYTVATQSGVATLSYSFGKPVIASNSGALPEQVKDGITGIVFPTGDAKALASSINYLLDHDFELIRMKEQAYAYSKELNWGVSANKLISFIENNSQ